jgi:hypothetical protein
MLDRGMDQAAGLRRAMPRRGGRVLPVAGAGEHPECLVRLAQALADGGTALSVVSDFDSVIERLRSRRPRPGLRAIRTEHTGRGLDGLAAIAERATLTLVVVDDARLARGLALPATEAVVLSGTDTEALATAYARIKAMVGLGAIRDVCTVFGHGSGVSSARLGHARLAQTVRRFLGVDLAFAGAAPDLPMAGAYRRLAEDLADWTRGLNERSVWRPH